MLFTQVLWPAVALVTISALGFILGKTQQIDPVSIAKLLIYLVSPMVIFIAVYQAPFRFSYLQYTLLFYVLACLMATLGLCLGKRLWQDNTANLLAYAAGTANSGFFGLPMAMALLDEEGVAIVVFALLGLTLYEFSYGFYLTSRGNFSVRESLHKLRRIPLFYVFIAVMLVKVWHWQLPLAFVNGLANFKGAYSVLGMLLIGLSLTRMPRWQLDYRFIATAFCIKFLLWPLLMLLIIYAHLLPAQLLTPSAIGALLLLSIVPMAGSCVIVAVELAVKPEKAATTVLLSTCVAVLIVPAFLSWISVGNIT